MTSGNPILDKNLECIARYNPQLKDKLLNLSCLTNKIDLVETELKEPNLLYNEKPLHNPYGAENEANKLFEREKDAKNNINIIFGIGLGYLFQKFCENSKGFVILYEPNFEILRVTLELVDFSKEILQKNVRIVSDFKELKQAFSVFFQYKSEVYFWVLDSYKKIFGQEIDPLVNELEMLKSACAEDLNMLRVRGLNFFSSVLNNLLYTLDAVPLLELKDIYIGKTALVISAGPTLDLNIEIIKQNRDKFIIFCVGTAFKSLVKNGINPDFLNLTEMADCYGQVEGIDVSGINLIVAPYTHTSIQQLKVKQKFIFASSSTRGAQYWSALTGIDISEYISKGTVAYAALSSAKMLGFKRIILVGQDLAFVNNVRYSKNSVYSDLSLEINQSTGKPEYKIINYEGYVKSIVPKGTDLNDPWCKEFTEKTLSRLNAGLTLVKGITGEMIPTDVGYLMFVNLFAEFAENNKDLDLINTSMEGAQIDGFKNISLKQALEGLDAFKTVELPCEFKFDKKMIMDNLSKEYSMLESTLKIFEKAKEYCSKFDKELKRRGTVTDEASRYYQSILDIYDKVTLEYFEKYQLYQVIAMAESLDLKYYSDTSEDKGTERIKNLYKLLRKYFEEVEVKILKIMNEINQQKEIINESINSES